MTREEYKEKLFRFNLTEKYNKEVEILLKFLDPIKNEKILDIGCGTGQMVWNLRREKFTQAFGYDVNNYRAVDDPHIFRNEFHFSFNKIYFMHSFAHIPDIGHFLITKIDKLLSPRGKIFIVTPNRDWLDLNPNPEYISDPTVVNHYGSDNLRELFVNLGYNIELQMQFGESKLGVNERILFIASK